MPRDPSLATSTRCLALVLGADVKGHAENERAQRETWAEFDTPQRTTLWMKGKPGRPAHVDDRNLSLDLPETWGNIFTKTVTSIRWALDNLEFDYLIRANTSTYLHPRLFLDELTNLPTSALCAGFAGTWVNTIASPGGVVDYLSGSAVLMSRDVAQILANAEPQTWDGFPDDVAMSMVVAGRGVPLSPTRRCNVTDFDPLVPWPNIRVKSATRNSTTVRRMHDIHAVFASRSEAELRQRLSRFDLRECRTVLVENHWRPKAVRRLHVTQRETLDARVAEFRAKGLY